MSSEMVTGVISTVPTVIMSSVRGCVEPVDVQLQVMQRVPENVHYSKDVLSRTVIVAMERLVDLSQHTLQVMK